MPYSPSCRVLLAVHLCPKMYDNVALPEAIERSLTPMGRRLLVAQLGQVWARAGEGMRAGQVNAFETMSSVQHVLDENRVVVRNARPRPVEKHVHHCL